MDVVNTIFGLLCAISIIIFMCRSSDVDCECGHNRHAHMYGDRCTNPECICLCFRKKIVCPR